MYIAHYSYVVTQSFTTKGPTGEWVVGDVLPEGMYQDDFLDAMMVNDFLALKKLPATSKK